MYHQDTELVLAMMMHELKQLVNEELSEEVWIDKINRLNRYTSMLITSISVMSHGMKCDDYNVFRKTLDRKSTRLNSSHVRTSYAVFCLKKKKTTYTTVC